MNNHITVCNTPIEKFAVILPANCGDKMLYHIRKFARLAGINNILREGESAEHEIVIGKCEKQSAAAVTQLDKVKYDGFVFSVEGGRLYITAKNDGGVVNGLYAFLENALGYRFYAPDCTKVVPVEKTDYDEGYLYSFTPAFEYRDVYWYGAIQNEDWASELHLNSSVNRNFKNQVGGICYAGKSFVHTLSDLCNEAAVINKQPCLTDEGVFNTVLGNVRRYLCENHEAKIISVSQNDSESWGLGCQCERCREIDEREGTPMGSLLTFVNRIANEIRDEFPDVYVDTLAYRYTRKAPATVKPVDNVIVRLCSIECCFAHPMDDAGCPANEGFCRDIEAWSKITNKLYVWDYTTDFMFYMAPFPNFRVLRDNVQFLHSHSVCGLFEQGNYQSDSCDFGYLRTYLLAKLLYDPNMTEQDYYAEMDEYLAAYYGKGSKYIREYIDLLCEKSKDNHLGIYDGISKLLSTEEMPKLYDLWNRALGEAETEEERAHIEKDMIQLEYCDLYLNFDGRSEMYEKMYNKMKKFEITHFRESTPYPEIKDFKVEGVVG